MTCWSLTSVRLRRLTTLPLRGVKADATSAAAVITAVLDTLPLRMSVSRAG